MHTFTIFTATYNRCNLLTRAYESIKNQTFKDFVWLVINECSTDQTLDVLDGFKREGVLDIYVVDNPYKPAIRATAWKCAFETCDTPYMVVLDDDDELTPDALQVFYDEIQKIKVEGREDIADIRALSVYDSGEIVISNKKLRNKLFAPYDMCYTDSHYSLGYMENLSCYYVEKVRKADIFRLGDFWLKEKCYFIYDGVFWERLSSFYLSRYLPVVLRLYHTEVSSTRHFSDLTLYSRLASGVISLNESNSCKRFPRAYFRKVLVVSILACALGKVKVPYSELIGNVKYNKFLLRLLYPFGLVGSFLLYRNKYKK